MTPKVVVPMDTIRDITASGGVVPRIVEAARGLAGRDLSGRGLSRPLNEGGTSWPDE